MSTAKLVAVVEDEGAIRDNYLAGLRRHGYRVAGYGSRKDALAGFANRFPDLVIIDVSLGTEVEGGQPPEEPRREERALHFFSSSRRRSASK